MCCQSCSNGTSEIYPTDDESLASSYAQRRKYELSIGHIVGPAFVVMNGISLLANLVILVLVLRRGTRSRTSVIIANLIINDIILLCVGTPWKLVVYVWDSWPLGSVTCKAAVYALMLTLHVQVYTILALACLRYIAIAKPFNAAVKLTRGKVYGVVCMVWVTAVFINIPAGRYAVVAPFVYDNETDLLCLKMAIGSVPLSEQVYGKFHFILTYTVPLVITFSLLIASILKLHNSGICSVGHSTDFRQRRYAVRRLVALTLIYAVCVLPINFMSNVRLVVGGEMTNSKAFIIAEICALFLAFLKCSAHPLLYNCMAKDFRRDARKIIQRQGTRSSSIFSNKCNSDSTSIKLNLGSYI